MLSSEMIPKRDSVMPVNRNVPQSTYKITFQPVWSGSSDI